MKIELRDNREEVSFEDLPVHSPFLSNGMVFLKIGEVRCRGFARNCVSLSGHLYLVRPDLLVQKIKGKFVEEG